MGFWSLFEVAAMPIVEVLLICTLGALMATDRFHLLHNDARKSLNKVLLYLIKAYPIYCPVLLSFSWCCSYHVPDCVYFVHSFAYVCFTGQNCHTWGNHILVGASLHLFSFVCNDKTSLCQSWISVNLRWFMPVNIGLTFLFGGILGWVLVKVLKPEPYLEGLVISVTSAGIGLLDISCFWFFFFLTIPWIFDKSGNLGNLLLIMVHAICQEAGSPFGEHGVCNTVGLSYASFSMAVSSSTVQLRIYNIIKVGEVTLSCCSGGRLLHLDVCLFTNSKFSCEVWRILKIWGTWKTCPYGLGRQWRDFTSERRWTQRF